MTWIDARYSNRCKECNARIKESERVWWVGGREIYCEECSVDAADYPDPRVRGLKRDQDRDIPFE